MKNRMRRGKFGSDCPAESPVQKLTQLNFSRSNFESSCDSCFSLQHLLDSSPALSIQLPTFGQMQTEILTYHQRIKSGPDVHPYCSAWYSWSLMLRPIVYFYKTISSNAPSDPDFTTFA